MNITNTISTQKNPTSQSLEASWAALGVLAAALAMIVLDGTIVAVALPQIIVDLDLAITDAQWITSLYSVVFAALLLTSGRLSDRIGRRKLLVIGIVIFTLASLGAGLAHTTQTLLISRAAQGLGGAMVLPSTLSTVNATFRGQRRTIAFGIWGAVMAGAAALGPLLGGILTTWASWRWVFWVNLPIGVAIISSALFLVPETRGRREQTDLGGVILSALGFGLVVFGFIEATSLGWWEPKEELTIAGWTWPNTIGISAAPVAIILGFGFLVAFIGWQRHLARQQRSALLDLSLFKLPRFAWGNLAATMISVGEFALIFVLPLYLVNAQGLGLLSAGLVLAAMAGGAFIAGSTARHLAVKLGSLDTVIWGLRLELIGIATLLITLGLEHPIWLVSAALIGYGTGLGLASAQLTSTVLEDVPKDQSGTASATQSTLRQLGAALGTALSGSSLALALPSTLTSQLTQIKGLPAAVIDQLTTAVTQSAGGAIKVLRQQGGSPLDGFADQVLPALEQGFGAATRIPVALAGVFLLIGLVSLHQLRRKDPANRLNS